MKHAQKKKKVAISEAHMLALEKLKILTERVNEVNLLVREGFEYACKEAGIKPEEVYTLNI